MAAAILSSILVTSFISGIFGMAGGMILMGIFGLFLPITQAMIVHGIAQALSNGIRAWLFKDSIKWQIILPYLLGTVIIYLLFRQIKFNPDKSVVYLFLGGFPILGVLLNNKVMLNILKRGNAFLCGILIMCLQLVAGASGPILDVFYLNSSLNRFEIIASKAVTQTIGHVLKVIFYISIRESLGNSEFALIKLTPFILIATYLGTKGGKRVLVGLSEVQFQKYARRVVMALALIYLGRGIFLLNA